jgi:hypothetical protein
MRRNRAEPSFCAQRIQLVVEASFSQTQAIKPLSILPLSACTLYATTATSSPGNLSPVCCHLPLLSCSLASVCVQKASQVPLRKQQASALHSSPTLTSSVPSATSNPPPSPEPIKQQQNEPKQQPEPAKRAPLQRIAVKSLAVRELRAVRRGNIGLTCGLLCVVLCVVACPKVGRRARASSSLKSS